MTRGLRRRDLLASGGLAFGAAMATGTAARAGWRPRSGTQPPCWGIAIDLGRCGSQPGCRRCIEVCHTSHRVAPVADPRHDVKWVWREPFARVFPEQVHGYETEAKRQIPVLVLCNHCQHPPCTQVCPTGATWRRSDGVVAMDEHRCIGCRYCMAACPYGARSFNWETPHPPAGSNYPARTAGVVEKCTMCVERIDTGREPLCVEACRREGPGAMTFGDLEDEHSPLRVLLATRQVLRRKPGLGTQPSVFYLA